MIVDAAEGSAGARDAFAREYMPAVTAYFRARWRGSVLADEADDAVQDVFLDCFRDHGALSRADPATGQFRAFLYGVARKVAMRHEERRGHKRERQAADSGRWEGEPADDPSLSRIFDRAWAAAVVGQAREAHERAARAQGDRAWRRYELLRLRFEDGLPIREIAQRWGEEPARLHHEYADARAEFRHHLAGIVALGLRAPTDEAVEAECAQLLGYLRME